MFQASNVLYFATANPFDNHVFGDAYPWIKNPGNWQENSNDGTSNDNWEIINRMQANGIYVSQDCKRDPSRGTFENRFCHQDNDCCYTIEFVKSKRNPCRMECRDAPPGSGGGVLLSPIKTCQFAFSSGYESNCE